VMTAAGLARRWAVLTLRLIPLPSP
jgi:hypothetical protein